MRWGRYVYPIGSSVVAVLTRGPRAGGEVQPAAVIEDPILQLHIFRVDMHEPVNAIVSLPEVGAFGVEKIEVDLCSETSS